MAAGARKDAKKVVFVLTANGRSNIGIRSGITAGQLKKAGVIMFAMGVTGNIKDSELLSIATSPKYTCVSRGEFRSVEPS